MKIKTIIIIVLLVFAMVLIPSCWDSDDTNDLNPDEDGLTPEPTPIPDWISDFDDYDGPKLRFCHLGLGMFREFLIGADRSILQRPLYVEYFRESPNGEMILRLVVDHGHDDEMIQEESLAFGLPRNFIDLDFLRAYGSTQGVERVLAANGVTASVYEYVFVAHILQEENDIPLVLVAYTDTETYFIALERIETGNAYTIYTHAQFSEKYGFHGGHLFVNGEWVALPANTMTFENLHMMAPLRAILEALGCTIEITADLVETDAPSGESPQLVMFFAKNDHRFSLEITEGFPNVRDMRTGLYGNHVIPWTSMPFEIRPFATLQDFEFFVDETTLRNFLELIDATVIVDYNDRTVSVTG